MQQQNLRISVYLVLMEQQGTVKLINSMYYSWCGFSNSYTKRGTGDTMYYTVTGTSKWRDANYREYGTAGQVNYTYKGSLS